MLTPNPHPPNRPHHRGMIQNVLRRARTLLRDPLVIVLAPILPSHLLSYCAPS